VPEALTAATAAANSLLEVFVDGIPIMVEPGPTALQVTCYIHACNHIRLKTNVLTYCIIISDLTLTQFCLRHVRR